MNDCSKFLVWVAIVTFLVSVNVIQAQISISGIITEHSSGNPLSNVLIKFEDVGPRTTSDRNGFFSMEVARNGIIIIAHPGYESDSISVDSTVYIEITLSEDVKLTTAIGSPVLISGRAIKLKLPAAIMQIHREHLARDIDVSIVPALNRVTGVFMHSGAYNTNRITIRGIGNRSPFSTTKLRAYLDDIPLTNGDGETTLEDIDLSIIENVDVWKGPTASIYGAGLGGMIHMKTNGDLSALQSSIKSHFTIGSYGLLRNVIQGNFINDQHTLHVGVNINTTHSDGYRENNEYDRDGISILAKYISSQENETTFFGNLIGLKAFIPSSLNLNDYNEAPQKAAFTWANVKGFEDYSKNLFGISQSYKITDFGNYTFKNKSSLFSSSRDSYESRPFNILEEESNSFGLRSIFEINPKSKGKKTFPLFSLGVELYRENYTWRTFKTNEGVAEDLLSDNSEIRKYLNLFAQSYYPLNDKATLFTGVNFNTTKYRYVDILIVDGVDKSGEYSFQGILSPHVGFNYQFDYKLAVFATISHGFSPPSLSETLNPDGTINPQISPEQGWNFEVGSRGKFNSKFTYELTAYTMRISDLLVAKRLAEDQYVGLNAGQTEHNGIELFLEYQTIISEQMKIVPFLTYSFSDYQFNEFIDDSNDYSGNALTGSPPHQLNLGVDFTSKLGIYGHLNYRYVDAFPMRDDNSIYSESYQVSNVKLGYRKRLFDKLLFDVSAGVRNVFNEKYASMILINAGSFGGNSPRYYYPGLPRNSFTSLSLQYIFGE
jgi:iron complex outermembrane receptor protein